MLLNAGAEPAAIVDNWPGIINSSTSRKSGKPMAHLLGDETRSRGKVEHPHR